MDGDNASRVGSDYQRVLKKVTKADRLGVVMAPGGGWSARFTIINE